jgi:hypothetical protein
MVMVSSTAGRRSPWLLLPLLLAVATAAALLAASPCDAAPGRDRVDPVCVVMVPCNVLDCTQYCVNAGLRQRGFCTAKPDLQFYCCCPVVTAAGDDRLN